jgi:2-oxoglutarate dehydrogenase E1 component
MMRDAVPGPQIVSDPDHPSRMASAPKPRLAGEFQALRPADTTSTGDEPTPEQYGAARSLIGSYRTHGHLAARLDPLGTDPPGDPALEAGYHGLDQAILERVPATLLSVAVPGETAADVIPRLREIYCGSIAYQIEHLSSHVQRRWLRDAIESGRYAEPLQGVERKQLLIRLARVEEFEHYLKRTYLGEKQFSIEGVDMMILMLDEAIAISAAGGTREAVIGMAHRGRLNVLAHVLHRTYSSILAEFEGRPASEVAADLPEGGFGDVKYHHGAHSTRKIPVPVIGDDGIERVETREIELSLMPNPSHLEFVNPVVTGKVRALQTDHTHSLAPLDRSAALAITIHGDAAFPGQGIVAETLNLQSLDGYSVGGTLHLIANNQVGFTTDPEDERSTQHSSDLAKGFDIPIIHVNADDIEACRTATRLAMAFRERFERDVLIDLVGYRRWGHNEGDEPAYTQPQLYERIAEHPPVAELYALRLLAEGVVSEEDVAEIRKRVRARIADAHAAVRAGTDEHVREGWKKKPRDPGERPEPDEAELTDLNDVLLTVPEGFTVHPKLASQLERRRSALTEGGIDWGHAESLAFASLLRNGVPIRLTGQDSERGTFAHRHAVLHDVKTGETYTPMQYVPGAQASFEIHNSPLSENACLGFEYGYSITESDALVIWEAQFGDFANGAQVVIDQFIASGRSKWGQTSRLTLFLPHGYEGNGPEHSSARLERFLQLTADDNMRIANVTTPAQHYHLLRDQALRPKRRPLVVMTPKGLLRMRDAASSLEDLLDPAGFRSVIDDPGTSEWREDISRLVLCTGRLYYDLQRHPDRAKADEVAIARVEQLYPFPTEELAALLASYPELESVVWAQEEPRNMGAWRSLRHRLEDAVPPGVDMQVESRPWRASPSEGYARDHAREQDRIVRAALGLDPSV